jgi:hypothetical protein
VERKRESREREGERDRQSRTEEQRESSVIEAE